MPQCWPSIRTVRLKGTAHPLRPHLSPQAGAEALRTLLQPEITGEFERVELRGKQRSQGEAGRDGSQDENRCIANYQELHKYLIPVTICTLIPTHRELQHCATSVGAIHVSVPGIVRHTA